MRIRNSSGRLHSHVWIYYIERVFVCQVPKFGTTRRGTAGGNKKKEKRSYYATNTMSRLWATCIQCREGMPALRANGGARN